MMRVQNKETLKGILLWSGIVVCLFLAGCQDKTVDHFNRGNAYGAKHSNEKNTYDKNQSRRWMEDVGDPILDGPLVTPYYKESMEDYHRFRHQRNGQ